MDFVFSILRVLLLVVLALVAVSIARWIFLMGQGLLAFGSMAMLALPQGVRWLVLLPALVLGAIVLTVTFNLVFWIGDLFGESFVGKAWTWVATLFQAVVVPSTLVGIGSVIAPNGRRWVAIGVMLAIWTWLFGTLLDLDTGEFIGANWGFYGWLLLAALSAAYQSLKVWAYEPALQAMESQARSEK